MSDLNIASKATPTIVNFLDTDNRRVHMPNPDNFCLLCGSDALSEKNDVGAKQCSGCGDMPPFLMKCNRCKDEFLSSCTGQTAKIAATFNQDDVFCGIQCRELCADDILREEAIEAARVSAEALKKARETREAVTAELEKQRVAIMKRIEAEQLEVQLLIDQERIEEETLQKVKRNREILTTQEKDFNPNGITSFRPAPFVEEDEEDEILPAPISNVPPVRISALVEEPEPTKKKQKPSRNYPARTFKGITTIFKGSAKSTRLTDLFESRPLDQLLNLVFSLSEMVRNGTAYAVYISKEVGLFGTSFVGPVKRLEDVYLYFLQIHAEHFTDFEEEVKRLNEHVLADNFVEQLQRHAFKPRPATEKHSEEEQAEEVEVEKAGEEQAEYVYMELDEEEEEEASDASGWLPPINNGHLTLAEQNAEPAYYRYVDESTNTGSDFNNASPSILDPMFHL